MIDREAAAYWIPAFAGMTAVVEAASAQALIAHRYSAVSLRSSGRGIEMTL
jgi:hypothetical protein